MKLLTSSANSIGARITIELVVSSALSVNKGPAEAALICRSTDATLARHCYNILILWLINALQYVDDPIDWGVFDFNNLWNGALQGFHQLIRVEDP